MSDKIDTTREAVERLSYRMVELVHNDLEQELCTFVAATLKALLDSRDRQAESIENLNAYIKKMDGLVEELGLPVASCINPYEDLKRSLTALLKERNDAISEASVRSDEAAGLQGICDDLRARLENEKNAHNASCTDAHEECDKLEQQLTAAQARVAELDRCYREISVSMDKAQAREARMRKALELIRDYRTDTETRRFDAGPKLTAIAHAALADGKERAE